MNLDKELMINTKLAKEYGELKSFDKSQQRLGLEKEKTPKERYIEYLINSTTKKRLLRDAKSYDIKRRSTMNKKQLATALAIHRKIAHEEEIQHPIDEDEFYINTLAIRHFWDEYVKETEDGRIEGMEEYIKACKEYKWKKKEQQEQKSLKEKEKLVQEAKELLEKGKYILPKSSKGILKGEIKAFEEGREDELSEFVPMMEKKYKRLKKKYEQEKEHQKIVRERDINLTLKGETKESLERKLKNLQEESEEIRIWWTTERRPDERTQRKAQKSNRIVAIAKEMSLIEDALERINESQQPIEVRGFKKEQVENYKPEEAVGKWKSGGSRKWWLKDIKGNHFPSSFKTKREAIEMGKRHKALVENYFKKPKGYGIKESEIKWE